VTTGFPMFTLIGRASHCKNAQVVTDLLTSCNKVVVKPISGCVRKLLSPCYKVDDGNRLATSCSNKTNRLFVTISCYEHVVINVLRADDIRLVGTTCCEY
jgi:hypothetical protein